MAVESRFVVIRNGEEVKTFMDKKSADEYDKMLDIAANLSSLLSNAPFELDEAQLEAMSIYLAEQREPLLIALQAKKASAQKKDKASATLTTVKVDKEDSNVAKTG